MKLPMRLVKNIKKQAGPRAVSVVMSEAIIADDADELLARLKQRRGASEKGLATYIGVAIGIITSWKWNL